MFPILKLTFSSLLIAVSLLTGTASAQVPVAEAVPPGSPATAELMAETPTPAAKPAPTAPVVKADPGFDRFVDRQLLDKAVRTLNSAQLTDVALQFLQGERVLQRSHRSISAAEVARLAIKVASEKQDTASLDRLASGLSDSDHSELIAAIDLSRQLGSDSRATDPAQLVSIREMTPAAFAQYRKVLAFVEAQRIRGDRDALVSAQSRIPKLSELSESERAALLGKVASVLEEMDASDTTPDVIAQLEMLSGESRAANRYAALSFSSSERVWGYSTNQTSLEKAKQLALQYNTASDATIVKWVKDGYICFARAENGAYGWSHSNISADDAEGRAMAQCIKFGGKGIYIELTIDSRVP